MPTLHGTRRIRLSVFVAIVLVVFLGTACRRGEPGVTTPVSVAEALERSLSSQKVPADFVATYDDMHGLWGGATIVIRGDGHGERRERSRGEAEARIVEQNVAETQLLDLIRLLVELRAWEQRTADRQPLPDESRTTLTISVGGYTSRVWEWFNEMPANNRLSRVRDMMLAMTGPP